MKTKVVYIVLLFFGLTFSACVDEYWPELNKYENLLVVDGVITSAPGPYTIKLSTSSGLDNPRFIPVGGAAIIIRDQSGNPETLVESEEGTYTTSPDGIQGVIGRKYRVEIATSEGKSYLSPYQELKTPTPIDSVFAQIEYRSGEEYLHELAGYQFYLNTKPAESDTNYYLWDLWATYKYNSDFKIRYIFDGTLKPFPQGDSLMTCWRTAKVQEIFTAETATLSDPVISRFPLHFVSTETRELSIRYSLLVKQFSLTKADYRFWDQVRKQNENQGGLYSNQPYQIRGNIYNVENPDEPVLGNFTVAGIAEKRIFVNKPPMVMHYFKCELSDGDVENFSTIYYYPPRSWPIYATRDSKGRPALPSQECMDCRLSGGTIEKPDFWTDY